MVTAAEKAAHDLAKALLLARKSANYRLNLSWGAF
jgi:hypothetical protein